MKEAFVVERSLPEAYHLALKELYTLGDIVPCPDWDTGDTIMTQKEIGMTMVVLNPQREPRISRLFPGGPYELQQYIMEMVYGILDFEVQKGKWSYTYHDRMANYEYNKKYLDQIEFVIAELKRNPYSRRAVIDVRHPRDIYSDDPACLQHLQFFIRDGKLDCDVLFRSNDACKATFMNAFALIKLQEFIAHSVGVEVGRYIHRANSFHCYSKDYGLLEGYIKRIDLNKNLTYNYQNDWMREMEDSISSILTTVDKLRKNP